MSQMELVDAIAGVGFAPPAKGIIWDGNLHRFATDRDRPHSQDGWYVAHDDPSGRAAAFGSWRDDSKHTWSNGTGRQLTAAEWNDIERQKRAKLAEEKRAREQAAQRAQRIYEQAGTDASGASYLARKLISAPDGVRRVDGLPMKAFGFSSETPFTGMIVPLRNAKGELRSLQLINDDPQQKKLFMKGGESARCFHALGEISGASVIGIAEGLATAQSVRQATGWPVLVAFSAGNLPAVATIARERSATAEIVICADDDPAGNKGAAQAMQGIQQARAVKPGHGCNDFNDLHQAQGLDAVRAAILGDQQSTQDDEPENDDWKSDLIVKHKDDGTQSIPCRVHNLMLILQHAPEFRGRIRFNTFASKHEIDGEDMTDAHLSQIKAVIEREWIREKIPTGDLMEALNGLSLTLGYHPVQDYLNGLRWDGIDRIDDLFPDYLGAPKDPYHIGCARAFFVSAVGRIFDPGSKVDVMTILEGKQGAGKSTFWEVLGGEWYFEITDDLNSKDFQAGMSGVWLGDLGELEQFGRAESSRIKAIITIKKDRLRRPYARFHESLLRQCVLVGGSNRSDWINDPTGGRRFLPVVCRVEKIDTELLKTIRDQLWAEAVHRYRQGNEAWWDVPDAKDHQQERYNEDPWQKPIEQWLLGRADTCSADILRDCLQIEVAKQTRSDQIRVGNCMIALGWRRKRVRRGEKLEWRYRPEDSV